MKTIHDAVVHNSIVPRRLSGAISACAAVALLLCVAVHQVSADLNSIGPNGVNALVNSIHHQAIKDVGRDLVVEAWSEPDRVVEALRSTGTAYVFAVQWHPEFHAPGDPSFIDDTPILDDFLAAAREHKAAAYAI